MGSHAALMSVVKPGTRRRLSRYGCRNCKLRKIKCDETKPHCERCRIYGVTCNFGYNIPDLQPLRQSQASQELSERSQLGLVLPRALVSNAVWSRNESSFLNLDRHDQELFYQFRYRTVYSLGDSAVVNTYEKKIYGDAFTCPALMHGILAMAALHNSYCAIQPPRRPSVREVYHSTQCTVLLSKWLGQPIKDEYKDAIWSTAVTLGILVFSSISASSFEEAWPLKPPDSSDLNWVRLKTTDKAIWRIANPMRPSSVFCNVLDAYSYAYRTPTRGIDRVPVELAAVCGLGASSTPENNPYFAFVHALSTLSEVPSGEACLGQVFMVVKYTNRLKVLLEKKDPVALLLLYLWYIRAREYRWWIDLRARHEVLAIRTYLQRYHSDDCTIQAFLV